VPPPRILVVSPEHWPRVHIRTALRERGYDAIGAADAPDALAVPHVERDRGPIAAIILEAAAVQSFPTTTSRLLDRYHDVPTILIASAVHERPPGRWTRLLRRPVEVGEVVATIEDLIPLPPEDRHPIDE
jgi:hypothetical protein